MGAGEFQPEGFYSATLNGETGSLSYMLGISDLFTVWLTPNNSVFPGGPYRGQYSVINFKKIKLTDKFSCCYLWFLIFMTFRPFYTYRLCYMSLLWALELERVRNHRILALHFTKVETEAQRESMPCPMSYGYYETEVILELESPDFFTLSARAIIFFLYKCLTVRKWGIQADVMLTY